MKLLLRYVISILGSALVGVGVGICVVTGLGADALGVLWEGLADKLPLTVGQVSLLVTAICLIIVFVIDKKELGLATLLNPLATSLLTDFTIRNIDLPKQVLLQLFFVVIGISFIGIGSGIAAATNTGKEGYIALSFALSNKFKSDLAKVRMILDGICFMLGTILSGKLMVGPVFGVLLIGPLLKITSQYCSKRMQGIQE
ncbi:putative membrane protein YczE [Enterococcus sp. PF1-24]|uniref:YczE/YyaS/YitT family protein n=1 Tax=unclassified Enterococcus TaxID=2608891 RepID=UPI0024730F84|nr:MULTISPECIES: YitT family protein [unclassified Enterococcus]MDH6365428.1 putative membrane protein YczE [Enterococcus sp. PFB1-1]MDH6402500.1 putative membrane protein YczE [Enterococcus sp. PF1-24]